MPYRDYENMQQSERKAIAKEQDKMEKGECVVVQPYVASKKNMRPFQSRFEYVLFKLLVVLQKNKIRFTLSPATIMELEKSPMDKNQVSLAEIKIIWGVIKVASHLQIQRFAKASSIHKEKPDSIGIFELLIYKYEATSIILEAMRSIIHQLEKAKKPVKLFLLDEDISKLRSDEYQYAYQKWHKGYFAKSGLELNSRDLSDAKNLLGKDRKAIELRFPRVVKGLKGKIVC